MEKINQFEYHPAIRQLNNKFPVVVKELDLGDLGETLSKPVATMVLGYNPTPGMLSLSTFLKYPKPNIHKGYINDYLEKIEIIKEKLTPEQLTKIRDYQLAVTAKINELKAVVKTNKGTNLGMLQQRYINEVLNHKYIEPWLYFDFKEFKGTTLNQKIVGVLLAAVSFTFLALSNPFKKTDSA